ncbi:MAG: putative heavy metal transport/detoxification protein [Myxococcaceae bacterium]|nr:putative heavy metal transport/detoxification protein [Myxococcaceae bacterium]
MAWKELVMAAYRAHEGTTPSFPRFEVGAAEAHLVRAEQVLGAAFPSELRTLLAECDGITEMMDIEGQPIETGWLMWPVAAVLEEHSNSERDTSGPPDSWLVFGHAGVDGVLFGYDRDKAVGQIWAWHPIETRGQLMATSLAGFLKGWITGELTL